MLLSMFSPSFTFKLKLYHVFRSLYIVKAVFFLDGSFKPLIVLNHCTALLVLLKDTLPINVHHCKKIIIDVYPRCSI